MGNTGVSVSVVRQPAAELRENRLRGLTRESVRWRRRCGAHRAARSRSDRTCGVWRGVFRPCRAAGQDPFAQSADHEARRRANDAVTPADVRDLRSEDAPALPLGSSDASTLGHATNLGEACHLQRGWPGSGLRCSPCAPLANGLGIHGLAATSGSSDLRTGAANGFQHRAGGRERLAPVCREHARSNHISRRRAASGPHRSGCIGCTCRAKLDPPFIPQTLCIWPSRPGQPRPREFTLPNSTPRRHPERFRATLKLWTPRLANRWLQDQAVSSTQPAAIQGVASSLELRMEPRQMRSNGRMR